MSNVTTNRIKKGAWGGICAFKQQRYMEYVRSHSYSGSCANDTTIYIYVLGLSTNTVRLSPQSTVVRRKYTTTIYVYN